MVFLNELLRNRTVNEAACAPFFWNQHSSFFVVNLCQRIYQSVHLVCLTDLQTVNGGISAGWFAGKNFQYFYLLRIFTSITVGHYIFWVPHTHTSFSWGIVELSDCCDLSPKQQRYGISDDRFRSCTYQCLACESSIHSKKERKVTKTKPLSI